MRFLLLFFPLVLVSQKAFNFDYTLVYKTTYFKEDTTTVNRIFLVNSKDNSYYALLTKNDSLRYNLILHQRDSLHAEVQINKDLFLNGEAINMDCKTIVPFRNPYKNQIKYYDFIKLNDTVLDAKVLKTYVLKSNLNERKIKRKKIGYNSYLIDSTIKDFKPNFDHETAYEEWKTDYVFPNGVFVSKIFYDSEANKRVEQNLIEFKPVHRFITIIEDCNTNYNIKVSNYKP
ncbi:MAG: hypothetical protein Tsb0033_00670 [Winogradskyella sp.]